MGKKDKKKEEADPAPAADAPPTDQPAGEGGDGEIVGGPRNPQQIAAQKRLQQTQAQVDEVVDIMRTNVEKVLERDQKLSELDDRADALQQGASQFEQQAGKLKRKFWLQNLKMMIIMGVIGLVIVGIIANSLFGAKPVPAVQQYGQQQVQQQQIQGQQLQGQQPQGYVPNTNAGGQVAMQHPVQEQQDVGQPGPPEGVQEHGHTVEDQAEAPQSLENAPPPSEHEHADTNINTQPQPIQA